VLAQFSPTHVSSAAQLGGRN